MSAVFERAWQQSPPPGAAIARGHKLSRNLVGAWLASPGGFVDSTGVIGNLVQVNNPPVVATRQGAGLLLNGSSQYLTKTNQSIATDVPLAFSVWIAVNGSGGKRVFDVSTGTTSNDVIGIQHVTATPTQLAAQHYDGATQARAIATITTSELIHVVCVFRSLSYRAIYINGTVAQELTSTVAAPSGINRVTIGYAPWSNSEYFLGPVVAPMLWTRDLSAAEILELYEHPWHMFKPRKVFVPSVEQGYTHPTLSSVTATNIGTTSFQPRVTYTF
jgi:hypothetical protein